MELVVGKNELLRELQLFQGIVERKNTIPILANVLIEAKGNEVRMLATDLEVALRSRCDAAVAKGGSLTLPAKKLYEIVKALPETDVRIQEDKNGVKVAADKFDSRMQTLPREDFPTLPEAERYRACDAAARGAEGDGRENAVRDHRRRHAVFPERRDVRAETRLDEPRGHRRPSPRARDCEARRSERVGIKAGEEVKVILPKKTLLELGKLLSEGEGDISYERGENHLFFEVGGRMLISRMIDGQFPAYERVIPKGNDKDIEFERERLTNAVKRVALLSNERSRAVKFEIEKGKVEVTSSSSEFGEAREQLAVDYQGSAMAISFNAQYVLDFLNVVETDVVSLSLKDEVSQAVMKPSRRAGVRLHLRDHADANLTENLKDTRGTSRTTADRPDRRAPHPRYSGITGPEWERSAPPTITARTRSRFSRAWKRCGSGPPCTSGRPARPGLHHLVYEIVDNSIDEALAGLLRPGQRHHPHRQLDHRRRQRPRHSRRSDARERQSAAEVVLTVLHAGGKFDNDSYKVSGGLHGVGVSVVNALSERLDLEIWRNGQVYQQSYERGTPITTLEATGTTQRRGTKVTFKPDPQIFETDRLQLRHAGAAPARARLPQRRHPHHDRRRARRQESQVSVRRRHRVVRRAPEQEQGGRQRQADLHEGRRRTASTPRSPCSGTTATPS